jgi:hypothetical protein
MDRHPESSYELNLLLRAASDTQVFRNESIMEMTDLPDRPSGPAFTFSISTNGEFRAVFLWKQLGAGPEEHTYCLAMMEKGA